MSAIALAIVWQQERFLMRQFDLRDHRQLLLHAVAHDLRPTAIGTVLLLQQLRTPQGNVKISQKMLQQMLKSCDRQLQLIKSLTTAHTGNIQLHRLYENLIRNAIEYTPNSVNILLSADVKSQSTQTWLHCSVQDNGPGLTPQQCDRLFERYSQAINARRPTHLGLGLYICHQIITAHGGKVGVQSKTGKGTSFWFTLPLS